MFSIIFLFVMVGALYFLMILPRQREMRRQAQLLEAMSEGDEVMISAGIYGTLRWIDDDFVGLEIADGTVVKVAKRAVVSRAVDGSDRAVGDASNAMDGVEDGVGDRVGDVHGGSGDDETGIAGAEG